MEQRDGHPTNPSLFAVGEGRRVADALGASVFALVTAGDLAPAALDDLAATLGRAGADRLVVVEAAELDGPPLDATHGRALLAATERIPAVVFALPAGPVGPELGAALAARVGAAFAPAADLVVEDRTLVVARRRADGATLRRLDPVEMERPVVATLRAGVPRPDSTRQPAEIDTVVLDPLDESPPIELLGAEADDGARAALAAELIFLGTSVGSEAARAFEAAAQPDAVVIPAGSLPAAALGTACPSRVLIVGALAPEGATGVIPCSLAPSTQVGFVVGPDVPDAPIEADAVLRLPADSPVDVVVKALLAERRGPVSGSAAAGGTTPTGEPA